MFDRLRRWLMLRSMTKCGPIMKLGAMPYDWQEPTGEKRCETCNYFIDYRETEGDDWANGYCGHPNHWNPKLSEHYEYGGHWTNHAEACGWWELLPASGAVDPDAGTSTD